MDIQTCLTSENKMTLNKYLVLLTLSMAMFTASAQSPAPVYRSVVTRFFERYQQEQPSLLSFARKREGWYVLLADAENYKAKPREYPFWNARSGYIKLPYPFEQKTDGDEDKLRDYMRSHSLDVYIFGRCRYYGYIDWDIDVIRDDSGKLSPNDTLTESLARAYSNYASKYLWNQYSSTEVTGEDSLMEPLMPLEKPGQARIDSAAANIDRAIAQYKIIAGRNPHYPTLIGDIRLKVFNETMNGYQKMAMAGDPEKAQRYLDQAELDPEQVKIAMNILNACAPNSILFTTGDNNTYQLWYIQLKKNIRKDISVINQDLLALPAYIDFVRNRESVMFSSKPECYADSLMAYCVFGGTQQEETLPDMIREIQSGKKRNASYPYYQYSTRSPKLAAGKPFKNLYDRTNITQDFVFDLGPYITLSDFVLLDMINTNINQRPVCFTDPMELFEKNLMMSGMVYRLLPLDTAKGAQTRKLEAEDLIQYLRETYREIRFPAELDHGYTNVAGKRLSFYMIMAGYFEQEQKESELGKVFDEAYLFALADKQQLSYQVMQMADLMLQHGRKKEGIRLIEKAGGDVAARYRQPTDKNFPMSLETAKAILKEAKEILKKYKISSAHVSALYDGLK